MNGQTGTAILRALAPLTAGIGRFFGWWFGELAGLLPASWVVALKRERQRLVVRFFEHRVIFCYGRGDNLQELGSVSPHGLADSEAADRVTGLVNQVAGKFEEVVLCLPRRSILRRRVDLPLAALENLREVLAFEMDRHTPFKADEVYFDYHLLSTDRASMRLNVDLAVVTRARADEAVQRLRDWSLDPNRLEIDGGLEGQSTQFNLLPASMTRANGGHFQRLTAVGAVIACLLLAVAVYVPINQKQDTLELVEARLSTARAEAAEANALSEQVPELLKRGQFVVERKNNRPAVAELLNEVTEILPDDTWLIQYGWKGDRLVLSGYSASPSKLIGLLERSELLREVRFSSPVTVDQRIGLERFNISATVLGTDES
jgi:general secretion pathway protein L